MNIWQELKQKSIDQGSPFTVLAPMEDVTDTVFRQVVSKCGRPDLFYTEFLNSTGFVSEVAKAEVAHRLKFDLSEKPIIAQIWGIEPEDFAKATAEISKLGFDGIDINMGCPVSKVVKKGACAGLIKTPNLAIEIIKAVKENSNGMPVSVKTRIGYSKVETESWISTLLGAGLDALIVHGRIAVEMSTKPADWEEIKHAVDLKNDLAPDTVIVGNGDANSLADIFAKGDFSGVDGVMVGRGIFGNQWIFNRDIVESSITPLMRINLFLEHIQLHRQIWGDTFNFPHLKKFVKAYVKGFDGASDLRNSLFESMDIDTLEGEIRRFLDGKPF